MSEHKISKRPRMRKWKTGVLFVTPALILICIFSLYPVFQTIALSFYKYNIATGIPKRFIGIQNFIDLMNNFQFIGSVKVTLYYTFLGVTSTMLLGIAMALLLSTEGHLIAFLRGISLMPMLICSVSMAVAWQLLYHSNFGLINECLELLGIKTVNWLGDSRVTIYALALIDTWQFTPFVMILTMAGLRGINPEYYQAAAIDGASRTQMLTKITFPLIKEVLLTIFIMRLIDTFKTFEKPYILTKGGPSLSTNTISLFVYNASFSSWEIGKGAAGALIITIIIAILAILFIRLSNSFSKR